MSEQTTVTISAVGLSNTDLSILKVASNLLGKSGVTVQFLENEESSGTIVVVDIDTPTGRDFYNQFDYPRHRTMLVLSTETINDQRNLVLKKPIRVQTLKDVLYDIYMRLAPKATLSVQTSDKSEKAASALPVDPNNTLFFILLQAKQAKQVLQIFCSPYSPLFVDTVNGLVATSASREVLRKIIQSSSTQLRSTKLSSTDFEVLAKGQLIIPLTNVLWSAALYGSYGQLIPTHSSEVPVQLKAWPNLSRLDFEPQHMKLASVMAARAMTLKQVQEKLQLPWDTIVGFYNAAWATGLIAISPANLPVASGNKSTDKIGLFAKIANRLKLAY